MALDLGLIVRNAVKTIDDFTISLQADVMHEPMTSESTNGTRTYGPAVARPAHIEFKQQMVRTLNGGEAVSRASFILLKPILIGEYDRFTFPDGSTGPILALSGHIDKGTGLSFVNEVFIG